MTLSVVDAGVHCHRTPSCCRASVPSGCLQYPVPSAQCLLGTVLLSPLLLTSPKPVHRADARASRARLQQRHGADQQLSAVVVARADDDQMPHTPRLKPRAVQVDTASDNRLPPARAIQSSFANSLHIPHQRPTAVLCKPNRNNTPALRCSLPIRLQAAAPPLPCGPPTPAPPRPAGSRSAPPTWWRAALPCRPHGRQLPPRRRLPRRGCGSGAR